MCFSAIRLRLLVHRDYFSVDLLNLLGKWIRTKPYLCPILAKRYWACTLREDLVANVEYKYFISNEKVNNPNWELGENRQIPKHKRRKELNYYLFTRRFIQPIDRGLLAQLFPFYLLFEVKKTGELAIFSRKINRLGGFD